MRRFVSCISIALLIRICVKMQSLSVRGFMFIASLPALHVCFHLQNNLKRNQDQTPVRDISYDKAVATLRGYFTC